MMDIEMEVDTMDDGEGIINSSSASILQLRYKLNYKLVVQNFICVQKVWTKL